MPAVWLTKQHCIRLPKSIGGHLADERLLQELFVVERVPAWSSNRLKRLMQTPKRYVCDVGLMAAAARVGFDDVMADGALLGRVLDSFVYRLARGACCIRR